VARTFGAAFVFAGAFYLLLVDTTSSPELYAGAGAALLAALVSATAGRNGLRGIRPPRVALARVARAVARIPIDIAGVSAAAVAQLVSPRTVRGGWRTVPFRHGDLDDAGDMGRRALAEAVGSLAPNTIVIGVDEERDVLLVHQLRPGAGRDSIDVLGLG
jgi:multisubunit Na+/H+ antiporter MnhE subunit